MAGGVLARSELRAATSMARSPEHTSQWTAGCEIYTCTIQTQRGPGDVPIPTLTWTRRSPEIAQAAELVPQHAHPVSFCRTQRAKLGEEMQTRIK
eukprot:scaffold1541_cov418-Prasinococcus_capsulatus_cf.AAC.22